MGTIDQIAADLIGHNGGPPLDDAAIEAMLAELSDEEIKALLAPVIQEEERAKFNKFANFFPDEGPLRRELYTAHTEFFRVGKQYRERCLLAGNRTGKTIAGAYETTSHLTGLYPHWWEGKLFTKPIRAWAAGDTNETTRDIIQAELLGAVIYGDDGLRTFDGSGMIPRECIGACKWKMGVQDLADFVYIKHKSGGWSHLAFKAFEQGRKKFQGTAKELIWLDEECPLDIYNECLIRTATTRGILMLTFTPLSGLSDTVMQFLSDEFKPKG
jgi:phage terminase large subunit-like protein